MSFARLRVLAPVVVIVGVGLWSATARAQYSRVATPFHNLNDSFYERIGVGFGFDIKGGRNVVGLQPNGQPTPNGAIQFRQGGAAGAVPVFGGRDPNADGRLGFATLGKSGNAFFNLAFGQGNTRSNVSQTPSVVVPNGYQGTFLDTSQTPFVVGMIPVVGGFGRGAPIGYGMLAPRPLSPIRERIAQLGYGSFGEFSKAVRRGAAHSGDTAHGGGRRPTEKRSAGGAASGASTAARGDLSVAEIRRRQVVEDRRQQEEAAALAERARGAEAAGKFGAAKVYYRMAARRATGELKAELEQKLRELGLPSGTSTKYGRP